MLSRGRRKGSVGAGQKQISHPLMFSVTTPSAGSALFGAPATASLGMIDAPAAASSGFSSTPIPISSGFFGSSAFVSAGSTLHSTKVRSGTELQRDGEIYLLSVLERNPQIEFLIVPSHCLNCEAIVKIAGNSLISLKEFYSAADISCRSWPTTEFLLREKFVAWSGSQGCTVPVVKGELRDTVDKLLYPLLNNYPRLKELQMGISARINHDALERIRLADRSFTYLEISHGEPYQIAQILMRAPSLKHIMLFGRFEPHNAHGRNDSVVQEAFLRHAPILERFEAMYCDFSKEVLQALLCSSPSLRILKTIEEYIGKRPNKEVELDALQVIKSPWICTQLEIFECRVLNVPRPDIVRTPIDNVFPEPLVSPPTGPAPAQDQDHTLSTSFLLAAKQESHAIQRRVLRQLGSLTHLRTLQLGKYSRDFDFPEYFRLEMKDFRTIIVDGWLDYNCLELSLEGGLDELCGLQELEELTVYQMAHRIGLAEVKWMVEHWPRLRLIAGLKYRDCEREINVDDDDNDDDDSDDDDVRVVASVEEEEPEHVKWIRQNRPDIQLI
ncbi:hypothetical protein BGZ97_000104 [Linnemannia gamsii]|uniref:F-box domain-containing protein n=1 Tax=Linnemannia gamsii TaxID=64522 RepID=A0A9P6UKR0_9FUNG|nr:hypothetical protein BGZ97_000104 [Linnemannia gamsii]